MITLHPLQQPSRAATLAREAAADAIAGVRETCAAEGCDVAGALEYLLLDGDSNPPSVAWVELLGPERVAADLHLPLGKYGQLTDAHLRALAEYDRVWLETVERATETRK